MKKLLVLISLFCFCPCVFALTSAGMAQNNSVVNITVQGISGGNFTASSSTINGDETVTGVIHNADVAVIISSSNKYSTAYEAFKSSSNAYSIQSGVVISSGNAWSGAVVITAGTSIMTLKADTRTNWAAATPGAANEIVIDSTNHLLLISTGTAKGAWAKFDGTQY